MSRTDLTYLNDYDYPVLEYQPPKCTELIYPSRIESNPFQKVIQDRMKQELSSYMEEAEKYKINREIRQLEKHGIITVHWDKIEHKEDKKEELSERTKGFFWGLGVGIAIVMFLL